jgi:light-regulated signal transduction histidine kinase (bacteriophytochrome)
MTEQRQAEAEIRRLNDCLAQRAAERRAADRELEALTYSISHDLRAPLRAIEGFSRILDGDYTKALDEAGRDYVARIHRSARLMGELIEDLLALLRIGQIRVTPREVDLSALATEISKALHAAAPERHARFDITPGLRTRGDADLLRIALENLLRNAWKFTALRTPARIAFEQCESDGEVAYVVRDNGAGFEMAYAGKLFGAFQRMHDAREYSGNGIGLAIAQRIIARHGGRIWAEAEPGNGAAFYFVLQLEPTMPDRSLPLFDRDDARASLSSDGSRCATHSGSDRR